MSEQDVRWLQRLSNYRQEIGGLVVARYFDLFVAREDKMSELSDGL